MGNGIKKINPSKLTFFFLCINLFLYSGLSYASENNIENNTTPQAQNTELFIMKTPMNNGYNAVVFSDYSNTHEMQKRQSITIEEKEISVNDKGIKPDAIENDGIYSGFIKIDKEAILKDATEYKKRVKQLKERPTVLEFAGRQVVGEHFYDEQKTPNTRIPKSAIPDDLNLTSLASEVDLPVLLTSTLDKSKVLFITDSSVVTDDTRTYAPCNVTDNTTTSIGTVDGAWSFKTLMRQMGGISSTDSNVKSLTQEFIQAWLMNWMSNQTVNSFTINARPNIKNYFPGWDGSTASTLDIDNLPFRLLAIVNRIDMAGKSAYGESPTSGETRFIFGLIEKATRSCLAKPMTAIVEYGNTVDSCSETKTLAKSWQALDSLNFDSGTTDTFNTALQAITDQVTSRSAVPSNKNGSAIRHIRTNDYAFINQNDLDWQLREFKLTTNPNSTSKIKNLFTSSTLEQTPDTSQNNSSTLAYFLSTNSSSMHGNSILCNSYSLPDTSYNPTSKKYENFKSGAFDFRQNSFWNTSINASYLPSQFPDCYAGNTTKKLAANSNNIWSETRAIFSLNTCNGCHARETLTQLSHINWALGSSKNLSLTTLSRFLTGAVQVSDAANAKVDGNGLLIARRFDELARRAQILEELATKSCTTNNSATESFFAQQKGMNFTH